MEKEIRKKDCLWSLEPLVVNTLILCVSLFGRGDRVIGLLPLVRGGVWFVTLFGRGVGCCIWLRTYPSVVRWCLREEFGTPRVVTNPPCRRFPRWEIVD